MNRAPEPGDAAERGLLLAWLAFHRDALAAKCEGLTDEQLVMRSAPPSDLSLLGLVRHMTETEHTYLVLALAGGRFSRVYSSDEAPRRRYLRSETGPGRGVDGPLARRTEGS